jgi:hypothetical protein
MKLNFSIGDRVRLSGLGASRCPRLANKVGTIVGSSIYANSVSIRFDGNRSSSTLHGDYIEAIITEPIVSADAERDPAIKPAPRKGETPPGSSQ